MHADAIKRTALIHLVCVEYTFTHREQQVRSPAHYHGNQTHLSARVSPALFKHTEPITELYLLWLNFDWY